VPDEIAAAPAGMLHGLYWLVANVADEAPVLFVVDDAQWADEPSLRFRPTSAGASTHSRWRCSSPPVPRMTDRQ